MPVVSLFGRQESPSNMYVLYHYKYVYFAFQDDYHTPAVKRVGIEPSEVVYNLAKVFRVVPTLCTGLSPPRVYESGESTI